MRDSDDPPLAGDLDLTERRCFLIVFVFMPCRTAKINAPLPKRRRAKMLLKNECYSAAQTKFQIGPGRNDERHRAAAEPRFQCSLHNLPDQVPGAGYFADDHNRIRRESAYEHREAGA